MSWESAKDFRLIILLILLPLACAATGRSTFVPETSQNIQPVLNFKQVGSYGPAINSRSALIEPSGLTVNRIGDIFISDKGSNYVYKFSPDFSTQSREGGIGLSIGTFNQPEGMGCDQALNLYVAESGNRRIQILDRNLRFVGSFDSYFDDTGETLKFSRPEDVVIDREGNFWIADNDKVLKLNPFYSKLFEMSYASAGNFNLGRVTSIDISNSDLVAIGDPGNRQIIIADLSGNLIGKFDSNSPSSVCWDNKGLLWVADDFSRQVEAYDINGNLHYRYADTDPGFRPVVIDFDLGGRLIISDSGNRKIAVFEIIRGNQN